MSDAPEQSEEPLDAEMQEVLAGLSDYSSSTPTSFCVMENTEDGKCTTFYYPSERLKFDKAGRLFIHVSIYDYSSMGTGVAKFEPSHPDYAFWLWVTKERQKGEVGYHGIERLKTEFHGL